MKKMTYRERADFYYEETYSAVDHKFLTDIIHLHSISSVLDIPCGAGRNLSVLAKNCEFAFFADVEMNMVSKVMDIISIYNFRNCKCFNADITNYQLKEKVDMTIVMRQALQLFPLEKINRILDNLISNTLKIIVLDLYCFNEESRIGQIPEYLQEKVKVFSFNGEEIIRTLNIRRLDEGLLVNYFYYMGMRKWEMKYILYNITSEYIKNSLKQWKIKKITEYRDYSFNLRKNENSSIFVIEL